MGQAILIISYVFPPYPGIGGRRWAKFARGLSEAGYDVHVICARNPLPEQSAWTRDIEESQVKVHSLPGRFPKAMLGTPVTFFQKVHYRLWQITFRFFSNGNEFERALFWKKQLYRKCDELITRNNIKTVIATGPPFLLLHHAVGLRKKYPGLRVVADIRDPWTDNESFMGYSTMPEKRLAFEKQIEREVLSEADRVLTVAEHMTEKVRQKVPGIAQKVFTLTNGYDPREVVVSSGTVPGGSRERMHFVYAGSLYGALAYVLEPFVEFLVNLRRRQPELYSKLSFSFYGHVDPDSRRIFEERGLNDCVRFEGWISQEEIGKKICEADACLLFFAPDHGFSLNTKMFEYLARKKTVVLFSNQGETSDLIEKNNLGYAIAPEETAEKFRQVIADHFSGNLRANPAFDIERFSLPALTRQLISILQSMDPRT